MCSVNHDLKAIYIHLPKNGGSYIGNILETFYGFKKKRNFSRSDHDEFDKEGGYYDDKYLIKTEEGENMKLGFCNLKNKGIVKYFMSSTEYDKIMDLDLEKWKSYYKFTFIRNPYDKIVSAYNFVNKTLLSESRVIFENFHDFLKNKENCDNWVYSHGFKTQYSNLLDINDELNYDYIGNFDNLNTELINILKNIGVEKITHHKLIQKNIKFNESVILEKYIDFYNEEILQLVNEYFEEDFLQLGFKKCETMSELKEEFKNQENKRENFVRENEELMKSLNEQDILEEDLEKGKKLEKIIDYLEKNIDHDFIDLLTRLVPG